MTTSTFAWLDHSESQRRRMLEIVDMFCDKGTLDELGFGTIRDSFADHFFPGISTIQTRARYLLFVPWVYRRLERDRVAPDQVDRRARADLAALARALRNGGEGEAQGVIGIQAGEALQRTPTALYWTALRQYRIWRYPSSLNQYFAAVQRAGSRNALKSDDGEIVDRAEMVGWHEEMPDAGANFLEATTFALSNAEADYLRERILAETPGSLLANCIDGSRQIQNIDSIWTLPDLASFSGALQGEIEQARRFSALSYGVALLYNLMLVERAAELQLPVEQDRIERYRVQLEEWAADVRGDPKVLRWRAVDLWQVVAGKGHNIDHRTRGFVEAMLSIASDDPSAFVDDPVARALIRERELSLKGGLARLTHRKPLERFSGSAGLGRQSYRWPNARRIVMDIHQGLKRPEPQVEAGHAGA